MTEVQLNLKDYKRLLSILSEFFGEKKMTEDDAKLRNKIETMHDSEIEMEKEDKDFFNNFKM